MLQELALAVHDRLRHAQDSVETLLHVLDQPLCFLQLAGEAGGEASSTAIRALIKQLVAAEDGKKPLSDAKIAAILGQQGIVVARRTIAKYRDALNIPPVNLRKIL